MKFKLNRFEKVAGLFVSVAIAGFLVATVAVAINQGWFSSKVNFTTTMETADGIHDGTAVQISGLRAGTVEQIDLISATEVKVHFYVLAKFSDKIKKDSVVQVFRPFIIGEKVLEISVGGKDEPPMQVQSEIPLRESFDIMDVLSGRKMNGFVSGFGQMAESLRIFAEAFADPERSKSLVAMVDHLVPLIKNLNTLTVQATRVTDAALKDKRLETTLTSIAQLSSEMSKLLPEFSQDAPEMAHQMSQIVKNLDILTTEMTKLTPAINELAPDLPRTTKRAVEALDETVVLLKAMQKSWFLRGHVEDVKMEEQKREPSSK